MWKAQRKRRKPEKIWDIRHPFLAKSQIRKAKLTAGWMAADPSWKIIGSIPI
jgi:hypothetical protein